MISRDLLVYQNNLNKIEQHRRKLIKEIYLSYNLPSKKFIRLPIIILELNFE